MTHMPFPSNENRYPVSTTEPMNKGTLPWQKVKPGEAPPIVLQFKFSDERTVSFACSDIRQMERRDAGHLKLFLYGMQKTSITVEGRHLGELFDLLQLNRVRWIKELGPRTFDHPEDSPAIDTITVEPLTGPSV